MTRSILFLGLVSLLISCASAKKASTTAQTPPTAPKDLLTQTAAEIRSNSVKNITYGLSVDLNETATFYTGEMKIAFDVIEIAKDLRVDFKDGAIKNLSVNGVGAANFTQNSQAFYIPKSLLKTGQNEVTVSFQHDFSTVGTGLHRFQDPEDKYVYLYTQFEPNDASRFMPCFDQPDMKAKFTLTVLAPPQWTVISSTRESAAPSGNQKQWTFPQTLVMSTYLFSLHAGPYFSWKSDADGIPLRLFVRKSLSKYVDPKEWFTVTRQGLAYYQKYFNTAYPFKKYDQIIAPEFNYGAMENVAAVTFAERFVSRGKKTRNENSSIAGVILHEMAHMWFGDLVTMKWWNDLWLNETFATFTSAQAMVNATQYKDSWKDFYSGDKSWAYFTDQLSTTHPIAGPVNSADEAFNSFDGITYGKGASSMKQLSYLMGPEEFRKGVGNYFKKYAFQNATLENFIYSLQQETHYDLIAWSDAWLKTSGLDTLQSQFTCNGGKFETLTVSVTSATPATPRLHAFQVAFLKMNNGKLEKYHQAELKTENKDGAKILFHADGLACPDAVYTNYNDYGYFKVQLDDKTIETLKKNLSHVSDSLLRLMVWDGLWQMVRDQKLPLQDYKEIVALHLPQETDLKILNRVVRNVSGGGYSDRNSAYYFSSVESKADQIQRQKFVQQTEDLYYKLLTKAKPGSDYQQLWIENYITAAESTKGLNTLSDWLTGKTKLQGLAPNQDRRWKALEKLCRFGDSRAKSILDSESKKDLSERGKNAVITCEAAIPNLDIKKEWWRTITDEKPKYSFKELSSAMQGFSYPEQKDTLVKPFAGGYFKYLSERINDKDEHFQAGFTKNMGPNDCTKTQRQLYSGFIASNPNVSSIVIKDLKEIVDEDGRCEKIRALAASKSK